MKHAKPKNKRWTKKKNYKFRSEENEIHDVAENGVEKLVDSWK